MTTAFYLLGFGGLMLAVVIFQSSPLKQQPPAFDVLLVAAIFAAGIVAAVNYDYWRKP